MLVRKRTPNELWLVPTTPGSSPRKLDIDVRTWLFAPFFPLSLHPDGRQIAFVSGSSTSEVMVLENSLQAEPRKPR